MNSLTVLRAASLWYPVMLTQQHGEISEAKAAELLGMNVEDYREAKEAAINAVMRLVNELPSPLNLLLDVLRDKPGLLEQIFSKSNSSGTES